MLLTIFSFLNKNIFKITKNLFFFRYKVSSNLTSGHICAGRNETRACRGDSGGPLINNEDIDGVQRYVQHGIISFGPRYLFDFDPLIDKN